MRHAIEFILLILLIGAGIAGTAVAIYGIVLLVARRVARFVHGRRYSPRRAAPHVTDPVWDERETGQLDAAWDRELHSAPPEPAYVRQLPAYGPMSGMLDPLPDDGSAWDWGVPERAVTMNHAPWDSAQFPAVGSLSLSDSAPRRRRGGLAPSGSPKGEDAGAAGGVDRSAAPAHQPASWDRRLSPDSIRDAGHELDGGESTLPEPSGSAGGADFPVPATASMPVETVPDALDGEEITGRVVSPALTLPVPPWPVTQVIIVKQTIYVQAEPSERLADYADAGWARAQHGRFTGDMDWVQQILDAPYDAERGELVLA